MGYYFPTPTSRAGYQIRQFLRQIGYPHRLVESSFKSNREIFIPFLKENNIRYEKINPRYKGINTADLQNCLTILEDKDLWDKFRKWCKNHKEVIINRANC